MAQDLFSVPDFGDISPGVSPFATAQQQGAQALIEQLLNPPKQFSSLGHYLLGAPLNLAGGLLSQIPGLDFLKGAGTEIFGSTPRPNLRLAAQLLGQQQEIELAKVQARSQRSLLRAEGRQRREMEKIRNQNAMDQAKADLIAKSYMLDKEMKADAGLALLKSSLDFRNMTAAQRMSVEDTVKKIDREGAWNYAAKALDIQSRADLAKQELGIKQDQAKTETAFKVAELGIKQQEADTRTRAQQTKEAESARSAVTASTLISEKAGPGFNDAYSSIIPESSGDFGVMFDKLMAGDGNLPQEEVDKFVKAHFTAKYDDPGNALDIQSIVDGMTGETGDFTQLMQGLTASLAQGAQAAQQELTQSVGLSPGADAQKLGIELNESRATTQGKLNMLSRQLQFSVNSQLENLIGSAKAKRNLHQAAIFLRDYTGDEAVIDKAQELTESGIDSETAGREKISKLMKFFESRGGNLESLLSSPNAPAQANPFARDTLRTANSSPVGNPVLQFPNQQPIARIMANILQENR